MLETGNVKRDAWNVRLETKPFHMKLGSDYSLLDVGYLIGFNPVTRNPICKRGTKDTTGNLQSKICDPPTRNLHGLTGIQPVTLRSKRMIRKIRGEKDV